MPCRARWYHAKTNTEGVLLKRCARASAKQRSGRSGRTGPGTCFRLYPRRTYDSDMPNFHVAEVLRCSLLSLVLRVKLIDDGACPSNTKGYSSTAAFLGTRPSISESHSEISTRVPFCIAGDPCLLIREAVEPPPTSDVLHAVHELQRMGALRCAAEGAAEGAGEITQLGRVLASLPCGANLGRLLVFGHVFDCLEECATMAAGISLRDVFLQPYLRTQGGGGGGGGGGGAGGQGLKAARRAHEAAAHFQHEDVHFFEPKLDHGVATGSRSDPLALLSLFEEWQSQQRAKTEPAKIRQYIKAQHASFKRLVEVDVLRRQLLARLKKNGIEPRPRPGAAKAKDKDKGKGKGRARDEGPAPPPLAERAPQLLAALCAAFAPNFALAEAAGVEQVDAQVSWARGGTKKHLASGTSSGHCQR